MTTIVPTTKIPCRAQDPSTCRYHSAEMRAEAALQARDMNAYLIAEMERTAAIATTPEITEFFASLQGGTKPARKPTSWSRLTQDAAEQILATWETGIADTYGYHVEQDLPSTHDGMRKLSDRELVVSIADEDGNKNYHRFAYGTDENGKRVAYPDTITPVRKVLTPTDVISRYEVDYTQPVPASVNDIAFLDTLADHIGQTSDANLGDIVGLMSPASSPYYYNVEDVQAWDPADYPESNAKDPKFYTAIFEDLTSGRHYSVDLIRQGREMAPFVPADAPTVRSVKPIHAVEVSYRTSRAYTTV